MPMFDDPKKELERLQEQLLQDEDWFARELDSAKSMLGDLPQQKPAAPVQRTVAVEKVRSQTTPAPEPRKNTRPSVAQTAAQEPVKEEKKSNKGLIILAALETLGIAALAAYWVLFLL